ncbi:glutamate ligase domain-containing protein [Methylocystis parvus]|uniref:glutamate ligase domain-containing protein n=1 Tax=Methylocystis parvus TaxID=134 RepID=UPI003C7882C9
MSSRAERLRGAPGRLELIGEKNGAPIFVDYAHKPDALEKVLATSTAGDRAAHRRLRLRRRPRQGQAPADGRDRRARADVVIVTDDNPRSEDAALIRKAIHRARAVGSRQIGEIADRGEAISHAPSPDWDLEMSLVVAGKGHETGQIVGNRILPFSDHEAVAKALQRLMKQNPLVALELAFGGIAGARQRRAGARRRRGVDRYADPAARRPVRRDQGRGARRT